MSEERIWLWKNSEEGKPEYVAYDNPWPIGTDHDDPLTLGEPAGWAYLKPSRDGSAGRTEEMAEAGCLQATRPAPKGDGLVEQIVKGIERQIERGDATIFVGRSKAQVILAALKDRDVVLEEAATDAMVEAGMRAAIKVKYGAHVLPLFDENADCFQRQARACIDAALKERV